MTIRKIITRTYDAVPTDYNRPGDIFYDTADGVLKVSDGVSTNGVSVERDPVFEAWLAPLVAANSNDPIDATSIQRWNGAWGWGNHATKNYAKAAVSLLKVRYLLEERDETSTVIVEQGWYVDPMRGTATAEVIEDGSTIGLTAGQAYLVVTLTGFAGIPWAVNMLNALPAADGGQFGSTAISMSSLTAINHGVDSGYLSPFTSEEITENNLLSTAFDPAVNKFFYKIGTTTTPKEFYFQFQGISAV